MASSEAAGSLKARIRAASSSVFNYWFGYVANISLVIWLSSRAFSDLQSQLSMMAWFGCALSGVFLWTLSEYVLHRFLYHEVSSPLKVGHDLHHDEPRALLGVPWWITTIVLVGLYYGLAAFLDPATTGVVMAFAWLGYIGYCAMHHSFHHATWKARWFVTARRNHMIHHARHNVNWGVTTLLWDRVFGTKA
jgi:sterol desaturase/sphingolipid hydroxylase (fatty acid hydroxylase superfamily)